MSYKVIVICMVLACSFYMEGMKRQGEENGESAKRARTDAFGETALMTAARQGNSLLVRRLINYGANVNACNNYGFTPLLWACVAGNKEIVEMLITAGASLSVSDPYGYAGGYLDALLCARRGDKATAFRIKEKIDKLYSQGIVYHVVSNFINSDDTEKLMHTYCTALMVAAGFGHKELVSVLIEAGCDVNASTITGTTLLYALEHGDESIVQLLLKHGARLDHEDSLSETTLSKAIKKNNEAIVKYLIDNGADVNKESCMIEAVYVNNSSIMKLLLEAGVDRHSDEIFDALNDAILLGHLDIINVLLAAGVDLDAYEGVTNAMFAAIDEGHDAVVKRFLEVTKDLNQRLCGAAYLGDVALVEQCIKDGANVNCYTHYAETPLMLATYNSHKNVIEKLLEHGASLAAPPDDDAMDTEGHRWDSALSIAANYGNEELVAYFIKKGDKDVNPALESALRGRTSLKVILMLLAAGADPESAKPGPMVDSVDKEIRCILALCTVPEVKEYLRNPLDFTKHFVDNFIQGKVTSLYCHVHSPFLWACIFNHEEVIKYFIQQCQRYPFLQLLLNQQDSCGRTPLMYAVLAQSEQAATILFDLQDVQSNTSLIDVNKIDTFGNTALYYAAEGGNLKLVNALLNRGARVQVKCIKLAADYYDKEIMINLIFAGARRYGNLFGESCPQANALLPRLFKT